MHPCSVLFENNNCKQVNKLCLFQALTLSLPSGVYSSPVTPQFLNQANIPTRSLLYGSSLQFNSSRVRDSQRKADFQNVKFSRKIEKLLAPEREVGYVN